jgi:hypothetical protein
VIIEYHRTGGLAGQRKVREKTMGASYGRSNRSRWGQRAVALAAVAGTLLAAGCKSGTSGTATHQTVPTQSPGVGALGDPSGKGDLGAGPTGGPSKSSDDKGGGPRIVSFKVVQDPACGVQGSSDAPFSQPAKDIKLSWQVSNAESVALSIDDPNFFKAHHSGTYGTYGTTYTISLSFPCSTTSNKTSHTYTINTIGGGTSVGKSLTYSMSSAH